MRKNDQPKGADSAMTSAPPLLVMAHGWLLRGRLWQPLLSRLEPRWRCWAPDLPGYGMARRPPQLSPSLQGRLALQIFGEAKHRGR